ncbi:hypothetical protein Tco_1406222 [Tanacetum coccineum]
MGGFHLFADVAKYGRTIIDMWNVLDGKPSVVDMSGKYGTSNAGAESVGVSDCNKVYKEAGNEAVMSISVDDCMIWRVWSIEDVLDKTWWVCHWHHGSRGVLRSMGGSSPFMSFIFVIGLICLIATEFAYWGLPNIRILEVNSKSNPSGEGKDAKGPSLDESLENGEHLDV